MDPEIFLRWAHVIGASVLLGTGAGIAFFMLMAHRTGDARLIAHTAGIVVIADYVFTATAALAQPITGILLAQAVGWPLDTPWLMLSIVLYIFVGALWLPVIWIQSRLRNIARDAVAEGTDLPTHYYRLFALWFSCGIPAFFSVLVIFWLMLARPDL